jgi:hypothetical protein
VSDARVRAAAKHGAHILEIVARLSFEHLIDDENSDSKQSIEAASPDQVAASSRLFLPDGNRIR